MAATRTPRRSGSRSASGLGGPLLALVVLASLASGCGTEEESTVTAVPPATTAVDNPAGDGGTLRLLELITDGIIVNEPAPFELGAQAARSDVIVVGSVVTVEDIGPLLESPVDGSNTRRYRLGVEVSEQFKGRPTSRVQVDIIGQPVDQQKVASLLDEQQGLFVLAATEGPSTVPFRTNSVLFEDGGVLVAPFAAPNDPLSANSLQEAKSVARRNATAAPAASPTKGTPLE